MKPTLHKLKQNSGTSTTSGLSTIWLNGEGCPIGTVPIKRIGKEDLIRQRHIPPPEDITFGVQLAVDLVNGNWWLLLEEDYKQIGFWPQRIFTDLKSFATNVEWGGVVYSPTGVPGPPMDSGLLPIGNTGHEAYCRKITVLNNKGETIDEDKTTAYADNPDLYKVVDIPHWQAAKRQHFVLYGGPGENRQV
nr:uncharacterized protein LOC104090212 [Nicotiana tomentosiformis]